MARRHVLHIDQDLVAALPSPDRDTRVPRVIRIARTALLLHPSPLR
jgi:hypothetical protein